jgi:hypothetical protein
MKILTFIGVALASTLLGLLLLGAYARDLTEPTGYPPGYGVTPIPAPTEPDR